MHLDERHVGSPMREQRPVAANLDCAPTLNHSDHDGEVVFQQLSFAPVSMQPEAALP